MSQSGLFTEAELPEHIYRYFDIKLEKDAFIKPTKDVINEIYKRFLDKTVDNWMKPKYSGIEAHPASQMTYWLANIFRRCNTQIDFKMSDILKPDRRRTISFLNVLIYIRVQWDQCAQYLQQCEAERAEKQEEQDKINQEVENLKVGIEELALRIGECQIPVPEWKERLKVDDQKLEEEKVDCKELEDMKVEIKSRISEKLDSLSLRKNQRTELKRKLDESKLKSHLAEEATILQKQLFRKENDLKQKKLKEELRMKEDELELQQLRQEKFDLLRKHKEHIINWKKEKEDLKKQCDATQCRSDEQTALVQQVVKQAGDVTDKIVSKYETSLLDEETILKDLMTEYNTKLRFILGIQDPYIAKNATFIKSSAKN